ncbi:hypothetical protein ON010_g8742 [Phytophthora cinnamomi]|nr:hypothetical protein ON010_g8742 [Phytophthora cinnamomi]
MLSTQNIEAKINDRIPETHIYHGRRSRSVLLATCVMPAEELQDSLEVYGPNDAMYNGRLKPIAIILRPGESTEKYEMNFKRWLAGRQVTLKMLEKDPEEERRYRQCFTYVCVDTTVQVQSRGGSKSQSRQRRKRSPSRETTRGGRGEKVKRPRVEPDKKKAESAPASSDQTSCSSVDTSQDCTEKIPQLMIRVENLVTRRFEDIKRNLKNLDRQVGTQNSSDNHNSPSKESFKQADVSSTFGSEEKNEEHPTNAAIVFASAEILRTTGRVDADLARKRLNDTYTHICDQIALNETAVDDALAYLKAIMNIDETQATEQLTEIKELTVLINQEKRRRDAAFAAMVAHEWKGRSEGLLRAVQQFDRAGKLNASHDRLLAMLVKLQQKREEALAVQVKLKNRLSWLKADDQGREAQFQELRQLSNKLVTALSVLSRMEECRQALCMDLLQSNESIRMQTDPRTLSQSLPCFAVVSGKIPVRRGDTRWNTNPGKTVPQTNNPTLVRPALRLHPKQQTGAGSVEVQRTMLEQQSEMKVTAEKALSTDKSTGPRLSKSANNGPPAAPESKLPSGFCVPRSNGSRTHGPVHDITQKMILHLAQLKTQVKSRCEALKQEIRSLVVGDVNTGAGHVLAIEEVMEHEVLQPAKVHPHFVPTSPHDPSSSDDSNTSQNNPIEAKENRYVHYVPFEPDPDPYRRYLPRLLRRKNSSSSRDRNPGERRTAQPRSVSPTTTCG